MQKIIRPNLKKLLADRGYTQGDIMRALGTHRSQVCNMINGKIPFPFKYRHQFCDLMQIDYEAFSYGKVVKLEDKNKKNNTKKVVKTIRKKATSVIKKVNKKRA